MKKILLLIYLITAGLAGFAQSDDYPPVTFGITGGVNAAFLNAKLPSGSSVANNPTYPGSFGVSADFRLNQYFSVRPGISYTGKGGDIQYIQALDAQGVGTLDETVEQKFQLNYLEVPVVFIGHIPLSENFNILAGVGPYVALGLNAKVTTSDGSGDTETDKAKFGSNGDFKSIDFGGAALLGFETTSGLTVCVNYDFGLSNIIQNGSSTDTVQQLKTGTVYLSLGFSFR